MCDAFPRGKRLLRKSGAVIYAATGSMHQCAKCLSPDQGAFHPKTRSVELKDQQLKGKGLDKSMGTKGSWNSLHVVACVVGAGVNSGRRESARTQTTKNSCGVEQVLQQKSKHIRWHSGPDHFVDYQGVEDDVDAAND